MNEINFLNAIPIIGTLVLLEGLLSADNALVMAIMVRPLPKEQQKRALWYGILGAFVFRFIMLIFAIWIIKLWYLRAAGAGYLAYLAVRHFWPKGKSEDGSEKVAKVAGFWMTVLMVNLMDCAFAIDSVLAAVGLSDNIWIVFTGVVLGIIAVRVAAGQFLRILEKWPSLEDVAYLLIGWIAIKLFVESYGMFAENPEIEFPSTLFWIGMALIAVGGTAWAVLKPTRGIAPPATSVHHQVPTDLPDLGPDPAQPGSREASKRSSGSET
jgi:YkoY family integral membrane protein